MPKTITGKAFVVDGDRAPALYRFIALRNFDAPDFGTFYAEGAVYSVREGNVKLHNAAQIWAKNKLVRIEEC